MKRKNKIIIGFAFIILAVFTIGKMNEERISGWIDSLGTIEVTNEQPPTQEEIDLAEKEEWKNGLEATPEFQAQIEDELEKRYWIHMRQQADDALLELQDRGFSGQQVSAVRAFLNAQGSSLAIYADEIVGQPRWVEALAIIGKETSFCERGVGDSRNNCGAIKNSKTGEFKTYANALDGFEDVVALLQKDFYKDKSIAQMNGVYCVYEEGPTGVGACPNWTEVIEDYIGEIHFAMANS